ncbi:MAG TPA: VOC family protein [Gemmatimonadaceae bacterium]
MYAAPDLDAACAEVERRFGVRPTIGGQHLGRGTRNALISIGEKSYLEIIGPDPAQPAPSADRWFGIDDLESPRLVAWAAHGTNLQQIVQDALQRGIHLGAVGTGGRTRPDGVVITWKVTDPTTIVGGGVVPFFIDWGASPHPATTAVPGPRLIGLRAEHPDPDSVKTSLAALDLELRVDAGPRAALLATFESASGTVELR